MRSASSIHFVKSFSVATNQSAGYTQMGCRLWWHQEQCNHEKCQEEQISHKGNPIENATVNIIIDNVYTIQKHFPTIKLSFAIKGAGPNIH